MSAHRLTLMLLVVLFGLSQVHAQESQPRVPAIRIAKETTRILGPLRPDGSPDYRNAYNVAFPKVPPEKNAFVYLIRAGGPNVIHADPIVQNATLKLLGIDPAQLGTSQYLQSLDFRKELPKQDEPLRLIFKDLLNTADFTDEQCALLTEWFNKHPDIMANLERAAACEACAVPLAAKDPDEPYTGCSIEAHFMLANSLLRVRAAVLAAAGKPQEALKDIRAAIRLARLQQQPPDLMLRTFACQLEVRALNRLRLMVTSSRFDVADLHAMAREIEALPAQNWARVADIHFRFTQLDRICAFARKNPEPLLRTLYWTNPGDPPPVVGDLQQLDINLLLQLTNETIDRFVETLDTNDPRELLRRRDRKYAAAARPTAPLPFKTLAASADTPPYKSAEEFNALRLKRNAEVAEYLHRKPKESAEEYTRRISELLQMPPKFHFIMEGAVVLTDVELPLTVTTLALAAWHVDHRAYPGSLESLKPNYLAELPTDPFTARPLVYHKTSTGFTLYSLGFNARDDHGERNLKTEADDISFTATSPR